MQSVFAGLKRVSVEMGFTARNTRATGACVCLVPTSNRDEEPTRKSHDESVLLLCPAEVLFSVTNWTVHLFCLLQHLPMMKLRPNWTCVGICLGVKGEARFDGTTPRPIIATPPGFKLLFAVLCGREWVACLGVPKIRWRRTKP